jgi:single-strand selective monofunctional uracil DNA glycosylase
MDAFPENLVQSSRKLSRQCKAMTFSEPVACVYNTLEYAWAGHEAYLRKFARFRPKALFLGMNPGPWGMAQTGVPFGEVGAVRDWMGIRADIGKPQPEHPARPVLGLDCPRSEVSGRRLWGLFAECFGTSTTFFRNALVLNYCPLSFMRKSGANITPDKLPSRERATLEEACDEHLRSVLKILQPGQLIGIGGFAVRCLRRVTGETEAVATLLHPSPASPIANREWPKRPRRQLEEMGLIPAPREGGKKRAKPDRAH